MQFWELSLWNFPSNFYWGLIGASEQEREREIVAALSTSELEVITASINFSEVIHRMETLIAFLCMFGPCAL